MWPGQQPPGGEQNPQDPNQNPNQNPYQQPGYQQPAYQQPGYQQPGYQQPNPYQQPTAPQYAVPTPPGDNRKKTTIVAIVAATAVVAAAVITGVVVLGKDDEVDPQADGKQTSSPSATSGKPSAPASDASPAPPASPTENPRGGSVEKAKPTIAGWKVVTNPKHGTRFDVPPDWEVQSPGLSTAIEDAKNPTGKPIIGMSAPAYYKPDWCEEARLGAAGTRGANGASDAGEQAEIVAGNWVFAAYDQKETGTFKVSKAAPFTTTSGLKGSVSMATVTGVDKKSKCDTDGKSVAFAFKNANGDFAVWNLYTSKGVKDELPDATIKQILGTVRLAG